jgi:hypothetical protein
MSSLLYGLYYCCPSTQQKTQVPLYLRKIDGEFHDYEYNITETHCYLYQPQHNYNNNSFRNELFGFFSGNNKNTEQEINTEFTFPNTETVIYNFKYRIDDGQWTEMIVEPKAKAEEKYQMAVNSGHQAFLAKENATGGLYTVNIGRLKVNQMVWIQFSYHSYYQITSTSLNAKIQLTKIPSYHRMEDKIDNNQPKLVNGTQMDYGIYFTGKFYQTSMKFKLSFYGDLESVFETKKGLIEINKINLSGTKDLGLRIVLDEEIKSSVSGWINPETNEKYLQVVWANYMKNQSILDKSKLTNDDWEMVGFNDSCVESEKPDEYIHRLMIIVDGSGSMMGERIDNAKQATLLALQDIPENYLLSMAVFGTTNIFTPSGTRLVHELHNTSREGYHENTYCDVCHINPIPGNKYVCKITPDYDLCSNCYSRLESGIKIANVNYLPSDFERVAPRPRNPDFKSLDINNFWRNYNSQNLNVFRNFVNTHINSNYGGTEMFNVLNEAYARFNSTSDPSKKYHNTIIFLTDGGVSGTQQNDIIRLIKDNSKNTTLFSLGIGSGTDTQFLKSMAHAGNGLSVQINNANDISDHVQMIVKCISSPNLRNVKFNWTGMEVEEASIKPSDVLFHNEPYVILAKIIKEDEGENVQHTITLSVPYKDGEFNIISLDLNEINESNFPLDRAFASAYIKKLIDYPDSVPKLNKAQRIEKITQLGCKYGLITPFTSAVAVEYQENPDGTRIPVKVQIPLASPLEHNINTDFENDILSNISSFGVSSQTFGVSSQTFGVSRSRSGYVPSSSTEMCFNSSSSSVSGYRSMVSNVATYEEEDCEENCIDDCVKSSGNNVMLYSLSNSLPVSKKSKSSVIEQSCQINRQSINSDNDISILSRLRKLVLLKKDDNTWEISNDLLKYIGLTNQEATKMMDKMTDIDKKLRPTYLVIAFFHNHLDLSHVWHGVFQKVVKSHFQNRQSLENDLLQYSSLIVV